jgi:queuine tRNA-ribosyltransferase
VFEFEIAGTSGAARAGTLALPHGVVKTPAFMPVGTQGTVRALSPFDLRAIGTQMLLANTYHLHLRPGEDVVATLGGLHRFMGWDGPILTDSGGFQIFSLEGFRRVDDDGVVFQSHVDGSRRRLTPEAAMDVQWTLGPDVAMALDHVVAGPAEPRVAADALARTTRWLRRCRDRHAALSAASPGRQTLWPILQGGTDPALRAEALACVLDLGTWTGIAVGGLAVGEPRPASCTPPWTPWASGCRAPCPVILWASGSPRICSRRWPAGWTCSTAWRPRATAGTARRTRPTDRSTSATPPIGRIPAARRDL